MAERGKPPPPEPIIYSFAYVSEARDPFSVERLLRLQQAAMEANELHLISGYLFFRKNVFFQYLEGPEPHVRRLMKNIAKDPRHKVINQVELPSRFERLFPHWRMRFITAEEDENIRLEDVIIPLMKLDLSSKFESSLMIQRRICSISEKIADLQSRAIF